MNEYIKTLKLEVMKNNPDYTFIWKEARKELCIEINNSIKNCENEYDELKQIAKIINRVLENE